MKPPNPENRRPVFLYGPADIAFCLAVPMSLGLAGTLLGVPHPVVILESVALAATLTLGIAAGRGAMRLGSLWLPGSGDEPWTRWALRMAGCLPQALLWPIVRSWLGLSPNPWFWAPLAVVIALMLPALIGAAGRPVIPCGETAQTGPPPD